MRQCCLRTNCHAFNSTGLVTSRRPVATCRPLPLQDTVELETVSPDETTHEVPYKEIALGRQLRWFVEHAAEAEAANEHYPHTSHGYSRALTNVHRAHPRLAFACALRGEHGVMHAT